MRSRHLSTLFLALLLSGGQAAALGEEGIRISEYSPHARALEVSRRLLGPVTHDRVLRFTAREGIEVAEHDVDLASERYELVVPRKAPEKGYGVLVFVSPIEHFPLSFDLRRELDRRGIIYIAAYDSGNDQNVYKRRIPLALHGLAHVMANYPVDPGRVFVSGFSGGSRVAQRLATAYPDVFRAALLVGGSDAMGRDGFVPPPADLMRLYQTRMRLVVATGREDTPNRAKDGRSRATLEAYCTAGLAQVIPPRVGHAMPYGKSLAKALDALEQPVSEPPDNAACRADLLAAVGSALDDAEALLEEGRLDQAAESLQSIDARYGGLASPRIEPLVRRLDEATGAGRGD